MAATNSVAPVPKLVRCAIYTRKSTEEGLNQEFNSLNAQREAAEAYIVSQRHAGWTLAPKEYSDGGCTGANIERPGVRQLLADIEAGKIDCVVVYKVDRLSRSLIDFSKMMELFEKSASFPSRSSFNTNSSWGD
jgi:site-specific DNA recombinase